MIFQNTPNTEAPREMNTYIPDMKALWMAENVIASLHNIYTLRGAPVRDPLNWSKYIGEALYRFGLEAEVMFASHHWPRWGNARIQEVLRGQRDLYAHMNNQVLHLANQGVTINEIHNVYEVPKGLQDKWFCRGYHGSPQHNSRGVIQRYLGFWDCNPTTLIPLSPQRFPRRLCRDDGRRQKIMARGQQLHDEGKYLLAPGNREQARSGGTAEPGRQGLAGGYLRAAWLPAGKSRPTEQLPRRSLRTAHGNSARRDRQLKQPRRGPGHVDRTVPQLPGHPHGQPQGRGMRFTMNLITPDNGEKFIVELENATLTNIKGFQAAKPDLTLTINRSDLEQTMMGAKTLEAQIADGTAKVQGDASILKQLASTMVDFDPRFEIMPGTKARTVVAHEDAYEAVPRQTIAE